MGGRYGEIQVGGSISDVWGDIPNLMLRKLGRIWEIGLDNSRCDVVIHVSDYAEKWRGNGYPLK